MKKNIFWRILLLLLLIALSVILVIKRDEIQQFAQFGYAGIFLVSVLSNATIIFPVPGVVFTSAMGAVFAPFWVAVASGMGATIGEMTGYMAGYSGQLALERRDWYDKITVWMEKYGRITVLVMAFIPNPFFDLTGMAAGALKMPVGRFFIWCLAGKILKMLVFSYSGELLLEKMADM